MKVVYREHVKDEALLDRLAHRVQVEGLVRVPLACSTRDLRAKGVERLGLGRRGERDVGEVLLGAPRRGGVGDDVGSEVDALVNGGVAEILWGYRGDLRCG